MDAGFTSVMIDASREPWEVNVARTKEVVNFRVCVPMLVEMCEWLVQRFAQEAVKV
jgi:fructose/tagatose bisphosphate aldolase